MGAKQVVYYVDARGHYPVLTDLRRLTTEEQEKILAYISLLEERGEELRRPIAGYLGDKLYELRPKSHRVLYFFMLGSHAVILHLFRKKTDRLPHAERKIALNRMTDFIKRYRQGKISI
jgi:phage-related protein